MFEMFDFLTQLIEMIVNFVINFFKMIIYIFTFLAEGVTYVFSIIMYLPPWVLPFVAAVIAWCVISFILNK